MKPHIVTVEDLQKMLNVREILIESAMRVDGGGKSMASTLWGLYRVRKHEGRDQTVVYKGDSLSDAVKAYNDLY